MTTLLDAARQALPGLSWEEDGACVLAVVARVFIDPVGIGMSKGGKWVAWAGSDGPTYDTPEAAAQWLRSQVQARRDALDAALGESDRGTNAETLKTLAGLVEKWEIVGHGKTRKVVIGKLYINGLPPCPAFFGGGEPCECGADAANAARAEARRLLEVSNV